MSSGAVPPSRPSSELSNPPHHIRNRDHTEAGPSPRRPPPHHRRPPPRHSHSVKDSEHVKLKSFLRKVTDTYSLTHILSPTQSIIFKDIKPEDKDAITHMMKEHGVLAIEEIDPLTRLAMACPAMPLCGLAITEAERAMPSFIERMRALLIKVRHALWSPGADSSCFEHGPYSTSIRYVPYFVVAQPNFYYVSQGFRASSLPRRLTAPPPPNRRWTCRRRRS